jgi:hypothetical protein
MSEDGIDSVVGKRDLFMCRIASVFLLQRLKGRMSGDARNFNNIETLYCLLSELPASDETWSLNAESMTVCCLVRAVDDYGAMAECCLTGGM